MPLTISMNVVAVSYQQMTKLIADWVAPIGALIAAFWAVWTYHNSAKLARARWMKELYEKFYEQPQLKRMRDQLDSGDEEAIAKLVKDESPEFTDYLNFFEFLAYLEESGQVEKADIDGIFGYYLRNMKSSRPVSVYVKDPGKGFEKLRTILEG